jgi:hypothetical protein
MDPDVGDVDLHCPTCNGLLQDQPDGSWVCLVGHAFSADELLGLFARSLDQRDAPPWASKLQALAEYGALAQRLAQRALDLGDTAAFEELRTRAQAAARQMRRLRQHQAEG